jgi:hypothetical protein
MSEHVVQPNQEDPRQRTALTISILFYVAVCLWGVVLALKELSESRSAE